MIDLPKYVNYATVTRVIDGDTFDCTAHLPFGIRCDQRFRLKDVDTPETWRPKTLAEAIHGEQAKQRVIELIEGKLVVLETFKLAVYGRYEASLYLLDADGNAGRSLADILTEEGLLKRTHYVDELH